MVFTKNQKVKLVIDWFYKNVLFITIFLGILALVLSFTIDNITAASVFTVIATALLSGGAFNVIIKSFQYNRIFQESLEDIISKESYLNTLSTEALLNKWNKVTDAVFGREFGRMGNKIKNDIVTSYIPNHNVPFHYTDIQQNIVIKWKNQVDGIVEIVDTTILEVIPFSKASIQLTPLSSFRQVSQQKVNFKIVWSIFDEDDITRPLKATPIKNSPAKKYFGDTPDNIDMGFAIQLSGSDSYKIQKKVTKSLNIYKDNVLRMIFFKFVDGLTLDVQYPEDLTVTLQSGGLIHKFTTLAGDGDEGKIKKRYQSVIFPYQGYMLNLYKDKNE